MVANFDVLVAPGILVLQRAPLATATSGTALATQPQIQLQNAAGYVIGGAGVVVRVAVTGGATVTNGTATTNASGLATFSGLTLTGPAGVYTLTFTATGYQSVNSAMMNLLGIASWPNDPLALGVAGWSLINDYGWSDTIPLTDATQIGATPWFVNNGGTPPQGNGGSRISDLTAPLSPPFIFQIAYLINFTGGGSPSQPFLAFAAKSSFYFGFWWKPSNPWQNHPSSINKVVDVLDTTGTPCFWKMIGPSPYHTEVTVQGAAGGTYNLDENQDTTPVSLGVWHQVEWLMDRSTGTIKWWMDGLLKGSFTGQAFPALFSQAEVQGIWGGIGGTKTENDFFWYDHTHITGHA